MLRFLTIIGFFLAAPFSTAVNAGEPIAKNLPVAKSAPVARVSGSSASAIVADLGAPAIGMRAAARAEAAPLAPASQAIARAAPVRAPVVNSTMASWYGGGEKLSRHTASGEVFRPDSLSAAHRTLPLGTRLQVTANGRTVVVRINDRGPAKSTGRSLDLSRGAARALGMIERGASRVSWRLAGR